MSKLNASNQSMNNTVLNQSTAAPTPPRPAPARTNPTPPTIVPASSSPSVAPQSLYFNLTSPVRPLGLMPMSASSMALNTVHQYALSSMRAETTSQDAVLKVLKDV